MRQEDEKEKVRVSAVYISNRPPLKSGPTGVGVGLVQACVGGWVREPTRLVDCIFSLPKIFSGGGGGVGLDPNQPAAKQ